ncbi:MAG: response regulator transcription factor [Planctomycetaceae bacterium]|nr:response regulator transcription factor [Planctomycetaceae bacterium]
MVGPCFQLTLVDNHPLYLEALTRRLSETPDLRVVGIAVDSETGIACVQEHEPHLVVINVDIPGRGAFAMADVLRRRVRSTRVLFWGDYFSDVLLDEALRLNAAGYLLTDEPTAAIVDALRSVCRGQTVFSPTIAERLAFDPDSGRYVAKYHNDLATLTGRQFAVLRRLARGESVKDVARAMALSERAVESHKYRIMRRLGIHDRVELARYAIREGLAVP